MSQPMPTAFIRSPRWWVGHPDLSVDHLGMLSALMHFADYDTITCFPSQSTLANICQRSRAWVNKILRELVEAGVVIKEHRYRGDRGMTSCLYRIVVDNPNTPSQEPNPQEDQAAHAQSASSVTPVTGGVKNHDTTQTQNNKKTLSEISVEDWKPEPKTLEKMSKIVTRTTAEAYIERFRAKVAQAGYQYPDFDAAVLLWFEEDRENGRLNPAKKVPSGHARNDRSNRAGDSSVSKRLPNTDLASVLSQHDDLKLTSAAHTVLRDAMEGRDASQSQTSDQDKFAAAMALAIEIKGADFYRAWLTDLKLEGVRDGRAQIWGGKAFQREHLLRSSANERMMIDLCRRCGLHIFEIRSSG